MPVSYTHLDVYKRQVLIYTSVLASGKAPQLQLPGVSQAVLSAPVQLLANFKMKVWLYVLPFTTHLNLYPYKDVAGAVR